MKPLKIATLILLLISALSVGVCAEHLPEENLIGKEMIIEKDSNIIKDNVDADKNSEFVPRYDAVTMTKTVFFKKYTKCIFRGIRSRFLIKIKVSKFYYYIVFKY